MKNFVLRSLFDITPEQLASSQAQMNAQSAYMQNLDIGAHLQRVANPDKAEWPFGIDPATIEDAEIIE